MGFLTERLSDIAIGIDKDQLQHVRICELLHAAVIEVAVTVEYYRRDTCSLSGLSYFSTTEEQLISFFVPVASSLREEALLDHDAFDIIDHLSVDLLD